MKEDFSRVTDIKLSNFLNASWLIILTELPLSIRNSIRRALFSLNFVFTNGLLIVKQCSSSEKFSFYNYFTVKLWGFNLQRAAKYPSLPYFQQAFPFATMHLFAKWVELPQRREIILILCYFQPYHTSLHFFRLHNNRLLFDEFYSKQWRKRLNEHLSMNWCRISVFWSGNSLVEVSLRSLVTRLIGGLFGPWMAWWKPCHSNTTFFLGSKWLFKASIAALYAIPTSFKYMKMFCISGTAHSFISFRLYLISEY